MKETAKNTKKLMSLKVGDPIWTAVKEPVFTMHGDSMHRTYFGHYTWGDPYEPWEISCIEGKSPTVFKPAKLFYEGRFDASTSPNEKLFVFAKCTNPTCSRDRYVLPFYYSGYRAPGLDLSAKTIDGLINGKNCLQLDWIEFTREDCLKKCRELNSNWHFCSGIGTYGKWYMKTINHMKKELSECMRAEYVVDPKEEIEKDLNASRKDKTC